MAKKQKNLSHRLEQNPAGMFKEALEMGDFKCKVISPKKVLWQYDKETVIEITATVEDSADWIKRQKEES